MMNKNVGHIWQPVIEPNDNAVPAPGIQDLNPSQVYTKTCLASSTSDLHNQIQTSIKQYNREVLRSTQSFNNSPKPFARSASASTSWSPSTTSSYQAPLNESNQINSESFQPRAAAIRKLSPNSSQQVKFRSQLSQVAEVSDSDSLQNEQVQQVITTSSEHSGQHQHQHQHQQQEENMAPKLIHKQYNSPIDLYSMNNIRKTIEAHTELIAPGLKGINFMKPETPINKQSEVYKLVMEEERGQQSNGSTARLSPISGQPVSTATALSTHQEQMRHQHQQQQQQQHDNQHEQAHVAPPATSGAWSTPSMASNRPKCYECGQLIVGAFARVQNKCVHPQCFNCTTCGTSLKNVGYFTVNDKLYCEIHAKQVANLMQINYDFGNRSQQVTERQDEMHQHQQQHQQHQSHDMYQQQQQQSVTSTTGEVESSSSTFKHYNSSNPASISTMFADRSNSAPSQQGPNSSSGGNSQVRWTWRPMTTKERIESTSQIHNYTASSHNRFEKSQELSSSAENNNLQHNQLGGPPPLGVRGRGLLQAEGSLIGGRIPVCTRCNVQIHGPYISAGKTTWCKACSHYHFNCCSCKRSLLNIGFIEDNFHKFYCEHCFEAYHAPVCSKCNIRIKGDCLNALQKQWHPSCFVCGHCRRPFGNSSFYLEDNVPYCERDWNMLFTTKCFSCSFPIQAGDKWIEALERNYHSNCFKCTSCQVNLEGSTFYCKNGKPYCRLHAR